MTDYDAPNRDAQCGPLAEGRDAYDRADWPEAFRSLSKADEAYGLAGGDLWRLAVSAHLVGRDDVFLAALERACDRYLRDGDTEGAAWCAFWTGFRLADRGEGARASAWLSRAQRLIAGVAGRCVVKGWLLVPRIRERIDAGAGDEALALAETAIEIADACGDRDLHAFAVHAQGLARLEQGRVAEGLALLDEAMLTVTSDALQPIVTGLVYCSVIAACRDVYALDRAQEWTRALSAWCDRQPGLVSFAGICLVHRAEIHQLHGGWDRAYEEARRAEERCREADDPPDVGAALYAQAEALRLLGRFVEAEAGYRAAAQLGTDPQPGLALLRSRQGRHGSADVALRRALEESQRPMRRARLLPALVEVSLDAGDVTAAQAALDELETLAATHPNRVLDTVAAHARGAVELARGDAPRALTALRAAWRGWQAIDAPYHAARARELVARACEALGDTESAAVELDAARTSYRRLGAAPDLDRIDAGVRPPHGLTARELEVLRLVASGASNKAAARDLDLSVRTIERHLANVFAKLEVSSRSEATAFAYEHGLIRP